MGQPTEIQRLAWPSIESGEHVVLTAPTGSGKTMAAFLCALNKLIVNKQLLGTTRILYISPLKALNNDIYRNLLTPLAQLKARYLEQGKLFPDIQVMTRSGDSSQSERRKMLRQPPEILITTPESLNLLLSTNSGRTLLKDLHTVILDEIHAVIASKRGAHLISAVERLTQRCGELQRIALSATVTPLEAVAEFIGGYRLTGHPPHAAHYEKRPVKLVKATHSKQYALNVTCAINPRQRTEPAFNVKKHDFWQPLIDTFCSIIASNRSTLLFTNSRRLCEKITMKINASCKAIVAYSHHGSLSREIRSEVEHKLKNGELKAIVATNSLELGIDIGALDEVVLVQSPPSVAATIQRLGRAGHGVGQTSHGQLFATHAKDFLHGAALTKAVRDQDIEPVKAISCPLDVLAQVIISECAGQLCDVDELYAQLRCSSTFHHLPRRHYDLVIQMLAGRYADTRIRELKPRLSWDQLDNTLSANKGAVMALYMSGGTIPNRGYYQLRDINSNALIGELDEEFVWEAKTGQVFTLGTQYWRVERITHNDVFVSPGSADHSAPPFWRAESGQRHFYFSCQILQLLALAQQQLESGSKQDEQHLLQTLQQQCAMDEAGATLLLSYLKSQRQHTGAALPHRHHLVIEHINSGPGGHTGHQLVIHTGWGGTINRPYALALEAAWEEKTGAGATFYADDDCIAVQLPQPITGIDLLALVTQDNLVTLLKKRLEGSGFFAARFRECAGRALLLTKTRFNQRLPLWMSRLQAQKLYAAVSTFTDFPILLESWRSCLQDEFDLTTCHTLLAELASGQIDWSETFSETPSPFARALAWEQINQYMYQEDQTPAPASASLRDDLLKDVMHCASLRPMISAQVKAQFECKRQRLFPGYCPASHTELLDWIKERVLLTAEQWQQLLTTVENETATSQQVLIEALSTRVCTVNVTHEQTHSTFIIAIETLSNVLAGFYNVSSLEHLPATIELAALSPGLKLPEIKALPVAESPQWLITTLLAQWLSFYGPLPINTLALTLAMPVSRLSAALDDLLENQTIIAGTLLEDCQQQQVCDCENFATLMRLQRASTIAVFTPLPQSALALLIAVQQGLVNTQDSINGVYDTLELLRGISVPASHWEQSILPARLPHYDPAWLDSLMQEGEFYWQGNANQTISFWFHDETDLWRSNNAQSTTEIQPLSADILHLLQQHRSGLDFAQLAQQLASKTRTAVNPANLSNALWELVWANKISNDTYSTLRTASQNRYKIPAIDNSHSSHHSRRNRPARIARSQFARRHAAMPWPGRWFCINTSADNDIAEQDFLETQERAKERARILLERYGMVCKVVVSREKDQFEWQELFRALRLMELSGEVLAGLFFSDIPGPQFISHQAFRRLQKPLPENSIFWLNATDPASLCGLPVDSVKSALPKRLANTQLVYCGSELLVISERGGKSLRILIAADDDRLNDCFHFFNVRLERKVHPDKRIVIETINGASANRSVYIDVLKLHFDVWVDHKQLVLQRRYTR